MRHSARLLVAFAGLGLAACGQSAPHEYPAAAKARFEASCPRESDVCTCTWDRLTRTMTYEEYQGALQRFNEEGLMDPRVTRARTHCLDRHES